MLAIAAVAAVGLMIRRASSNSGASENIDYRVIERARVDGNKNLLSEVLELVELPSGRIVIDQIQDYQIRFFDSAGKDLGTFGRKGEGPGEFGDIRMIGTVGHTDTVWVSSMDNRTAFISPEQKLVRTSRWPVGLQISFTGKDSVLKFEHGFWTPMGFLPGGLGLISITLLPPLPSWAQGSKQVGIQGNEFATSTFQVTSSGKVLGPISWAPDLSRCRGVLAFCNDLPDRIADDGRSSIHVDMTNATGRSASYTIMVMQGPGDTTLVKSLSYTPVSIPKAVKDSVRSVKLTNARTAQQKERVEKGTFPETFLPLRTYLIGGDNSIWLKRWPLSTTQTWLVLDRKGATLGSVAIPPEARVMTANFNEKRIWAILTDKDGVEHLVRYQIARK